jgi:hypothetical protein
MGPAKVNCPTSITLSIRLLLDDTWREHSLAVPSPARSGKVLIQVRVMKSKWMILLPQQLL